jgi:hypothetical protein
MYETAVHEQRFSRTITIDSCTASLHFTRSVIDKLGSVRTILFTQKTIFAHCNRKRLTPEPAQNFNINLCATRNSMTDEGRTVKNKPYNRCAGAGIAGTDGVA